MRRIEILSFFLALLMAMDVAQANDPSGQFPGVYVLEGSRVPLTVEEMDTVQLKCLLAPGVMHDGGLGVGYFFTLEKFHTSRGKSIAAGIQLRRARKRVTPRNSAMARA
jgi:hypothetical protein